jgi:hypothetical protein
MVDSQSGYMHIYIQPPCGLCLFWCLPVHCRLFILLCHMSFTVDEGMEVCVVPMSDTAANTAPAWQKFLHMHAEELEPILSHCGVDEQEVLNISDTHDAMINGADWPDVTPESRLSRSLCDNGQRRAILHFMEKYAQANPSMLLPSFVMLHVLYPSVSVKDHCTAINTHESRTIGSSECVSFDSTIACSCDDTTSGIQAFDALVFVINRLLMPLAASRMLPQVEDDLWGRVWSSGFYRILSAFFTCHGDWRLTGRLPTETARIYMQNLEMLMSQSVRVLFSTEGSFTLVDTSPVSDTTGCTTAEILSNVLSMDIHHEWMTAHIIRDEDAQRRWIPRLLVHIHGEQQKENKAVVGDVLRGLFVEQRMTPVTPCSILLILMLMGCYIPPDCRGNGFPWTSSCAIGPQISKLHQWLVGLRSPTSNDNSRGSGTLAIIHQEDTAEYQGDLNSFLQTDHARGVAIVGIDNENPCRSAIVADTLKRFVFRHTVCEHQQDRASVCYTVHTTHLFLCGQH